MIYRNSCKNLDLYHGIGSVFPVKFKIISGGQTGVDRAAIDAAIAVGLPYGGIIPKGRLAEDGTISKIYILTEAPSPEYTYRTEQNVIHSDATLIVSYLPINGGTSLTEEYCQKHSKTYFIANLDDPHIEQKILDWLQKTKPKVLNIAGPRESKFPGIYKTTQKLFEKIFKKLVLPDKQT